MDNFTLVCPKTERPNVRYAVKSINAPSQYRWTVVSMVSLVTMLPLLLTRLGFSFGSASQGGAGAHFAGMNINDIIFRFDINSISMVAVILAMTIIYNRINQSRFVLILGLTLAVSGFNDSIHVIPLYTSSGASSSFHIGAVWATTLGRFGSACILLAGMITLRYGRYMTQRKTVLQTLVPAIGFLFLTRASMFGFIKLQAIPSETLNLLTLCMYLGSGFILKSQIRSFKLRFFGHGVLAMLIPLATGIIWMTASVTTIYDQGFHIAVLLKWFAWLMPAAGLGIDYVNTFYARGMSGEKRFLRAVIDSIPHFIFTRDTNGRFTLVNKAVADFYGLKVHEIEGRHLMKIHNNAEQCREWIKEDRDTVAGGKLWKSPETEATDINGNPIWITAIKRPLKVGRTQEDQVLGVSIDMTQQKEAEMALSERLEMETVASSILESFVH